MLFECISRERRKMSKPKKTFRFCEDVMEILENRDKTRYRSETVFVEEAIRSIHEQDKIQRVFQMLSGIETKLDRIMREQEVVSALEINSLE